MQQPTRLISTPFAQEGEKTEIQNVTGEFDNSATYRLGFPPLTMQSIRLGGKPPKGTDFNGVLFDITENISFLCKGGRYQYNAGLSTLIGGYPEGSNLLLNDNVTEVVSTVAGNQNNPNTDMTGWTFKPNRTTTEYVLDASGETQQQVNYNGGAKWYSRVGGYQENERVVLTNGDIVKSTIDGNVNDPNFDMTGWELPQARDVFDESGKNLQEVNDTNAKYLRFVTPSVFGIYDSTAVDQASKLQDMIYFAVNNGLTIIGERITVGVKSQIIIPPTLSAKWGGLKIKYLSGFAGGSGSLVSVGKGSSTATWQKGSPLDCLVIEGVSGNVPDMSMTLDGLYIGDAGMQTSDLLFVNLKVTGFRDSVNIKGPSSYLLTFIQPQIGVAKRYGLVYSASVDSGENIKFFGGSIFNCVNNTFDSTGFYLAPTASTLDITFSGTSFDYCDISIDQAHSSVSLNDCHFENNNNNPHIKLRSTGGKVKTILRMRSGNLGGGPNGTNPLFGNPVEDANGRPCYVELLGDSISVDINEVLCGSYRVAGQKTEIVKNTGGFGQRRIRIKPMLDASRETTSSVPCTLSNSFQNSLYVAPDGATTGWTVQGSWSADATVKAAYDTGSRLLKTASESGSLIQEIPCSAGQTIVVKAWIKTEGLTQGYATIRLQFINAAGTTILDDISPRQANKDTLVLTEISNCRQVPDGAVKVRILDYASGMQTTTTKKVWFTGERVWLY